MILKWDFVGGRLQWSCRSRRAVFRLPSVCSIMVYSTMVRGGIAYILMVIGVVLISVMMLAAIS